jgi:geranylgeranyl diphosphate synthase type II
VRVSIVTDTWDVRQNWHATATPVGVGRGGWMDAQLRIEQALDAALRLGESAAAPPRLQAATRHAVFPGGARIRPQPVSGCRLGLRRRPSAAGRRRGRRRSSCCIAPRWCTTTCPASTTRRCAAARPSVHAAYGERLAVLVGDALIVLAFQRTGRGRPSRSGPPRASADDGRPTASARPSASSPGRPGNASRRPTLATYQRAKTGALFAAATAAGAQAAGARPRRLARPR